MNLRYLCLTFALVSSPPLLAQASRDTTKANNAANDSTKLEEDEPTHGLTYGVTGGAMSFPDGRTQQSFGAVVRLHLFDGLAIAATPAAARVQFPAAIGGTAHGMTDLPVDVNYDHGIPRTPLSIGATLAASIPVGDTASGFGSGQMGYSVSGGLNLEANDRLSFHVGAGRPLSDFSFQSALGGSTSTWGDAEINYQLSDRVGASINLDGDFASADSIGPSRAMGAGLSIALLGSTTLTISASHRLSGGAASWTTAIGLGTDFAWIGSVASTSAMQRMTNALGGQSHGHGRGQSTTSGTSGRGHSG